MDTIFLFVPLGHAIARIGCLMAGCCYGRVITLSLLGATYTVKNPVPLYEALLNVCLHFVLRAAYRRVYSKPQAGKGDGSIAALYLLGYGTYRMYLETLRVEKVLAYGLTQAQTVMLFFIIVGGSVLIYKAVKKYVFSGE
jgi:phosphatidylglycerol:prolipoprotein diacylglycerol transferase